MSINEKKVKKFIKISAVLLGITFIGMFGIALKKKKGSAYEDTPEEKNPMEGKRVIFVEDDSEEENADGVRGHLEAVGESDYKPSIYDKYVKRAIDVILSFGGLVILAPVFAAIALAIKIEDPGPVLFTQKRVGQNKKYFKLHKFRSMKVSTPHDVPTHMLDNPEQYITKVGKFIRAHSLDELPQIWDIFVGNMSVIGPRPALWNQDLLTAERDKYGANDVKPGLTGWAQINGRDELEIPEKAKLDGEYVKKLGLGMDLRCFFGSIGVFAHDDSVVEGGTGEMKKYCPNGEVLQRYDAVVDNPKVSVIVATYRRSDSLKRALDSLKNQSYRNIEIIIVDDNADDEWNKSVKKIISDTVSRDIVSYIQNQENKGSAKSRNIGIQAATGDFVTFLDDDDVYLPNKIKNQLFYMLDNKADYSLTDLELYHEDGRLGENRTRRYIKSIDKKDLLKYHLMYHMTGTDTMMFKRKYLLYIGGFEPIDVGDEFYLMMKAIKAGGKFCYAPVCDVKAYIHVNSHGLSSGQKKIEGENRLYDYKFKFFKSLSPKNIRYIRMRHFAVLAFAYLRMRKYIPFFTNAMKSFFVSPILCTELFIGRKTK